MNTSPLDQARAAVADCRAALDRTADALHHLQPIATDPLTVAFIAIGASLAIRQLPDFAPAALWLAGDCVADLRDSASGEGFALLTTCAYCDGHGDTYEGNETPTICPRCDGKGNKELTA